VRKVGYKLAITNFDRALDVGFRRPAVFLERGRAWAGAGDRKRAIDDYSEAIAKEPRFAPAYYYRSLAYRAIGKTTEADADLRMAGKLGFENTSVP
jgi:tetratricopeptide (TPR) repeat protein